MRRLFWMTVGAGAAVWTINRVNELTRSLTPGSLADSAARGAVDVGDAVRSFAGEVRSAMIQRELELNRQLGLDGSALAIPGQATAPVLRSAPVRAALTAPIRRGDGHRGGRRDAPGDDRPRDDHFEDHRDNEHDRKEGH